MLSFDGSIYIERPPAIVWDVVGTRLFETQPEWEDGIVAIHPLQDGPIGLSVEPNGPHGTLLRFVVLAVVSGLMRFLEPLAQPMLEQARSKTLLDIKEYVERNTQSQI